MMDFSSTIPDIHSGVSSSFVEGVIQTQRDAKFTGLLRLHYPSGENLVFAFLEGAQKKLYSSLEQSIQIIPHQFWSSYIARSEASVGLLRLSIEGLRLMRLVHEAPISQIHRMQLSAQDLVNSTEKWVKEPSPSIVHIRGESLDKFYVISGYANPILEELTFSGDQARFFISDNSFPNLLPPAEYQIARYVSNNNYEIWQEYELRFAFHPLMRLLLGRFSELAGRILTERLCEQLTAWIKDCGWNINITINGVSHHHYFESLHDAKHAYLKIVQKFNEFASPAIGEHITSGVVHNLLPRLDPYHRTLLLWHIYDQEGVALKAESGKL